MTKEKRKNFSIGEKGANYIADQLNCSQTTVYLALRGITETELADEIREMRRTRFYVPAGKRKGILRPEYR